VVVASGRTAAPLRRTAVRRSPSHRGDWRLALILILPATAGFCVFAAYPTIRGIYLSFTNFRILSPPTWAGLTNYRHLFSDDVFWNSLRVTVYFVALTVGVGLAVSLTSAVILHRLTQSTVIRGLVAVAVPDLRRRCALVWQWMLDPGSDHQRRGQSSEWVTNILFLGSQDWVIPSLSFISIWSRWVTTPS